MPIISGPTRRCPCPCGSALNCRTLHNAQGRFLALVCDECEAHRRIIHRLEPEQAPATPARLPWIKGNAGGGE